MLEHFLKEVIFDLEKISAKLNRHSGINSGWKRAKLNENYQEH